MPDPVADAVSKVETAIAEVLTAYPDLADWTVLTDQPFDSAIEGDDILAIVVRTMGPQFDNSFEPGAQTLNSLTVDLEAVVMVAGDPIARRAREGLGHALAALTEDRSLGGMLQDLQEIDAAQGDGQRREAGAISLQLRAEYLTARGDAFTIRGFGGLTF